VPLPPQHGPMGLPLTAAAVLLVLLLLSLLPVVLVESMFKLVCMLGGRVPQVSIPRHLGWC